jgi:hypothetical protein
VTDAELRTAIFADPAARALADAGNDAGCAARMAAVLPPAAVSRLIDETSFFRAFADPTEAETVLQTLEAIGDQNPVVKRFLKFLGPGSYGLDMGNPMLRAMLDSMVGTTPLTADQVAAVKALAEVPAVVSADDVSRAWSVYRAGGKIQ